MMKKGFTIVETLVAIAILMIAIAGPLVVASKGLTAALYARDQTIATYLAQESMELIKNTRDNNLSADNQQNWLLNLDSCINSNCDASYLSDYSESCGSNGCQLYFAANGYGRDSVNQPSLFKRRFTLTHPPLRNSCAADGSECIVTVYVTWQQGGVPNEVKLTSHITNAER